MTNKSFFIIRIIFSFVFTNLSFDTVNCDILVTGRCGRPGLPPNAHFDKISTEKSRFDNKEEVLVICKENEFSHHKQTKFCNNGNWTGKKSRCGKHIIAQVIKLEIKDCDLPESYLLVSQQLNQSTETIRPLPPNAFDVSRVGSNIILSGENSTCYIWEIQFDKKVQISFLTIDIYYFVINMTKDVPNLLPIVSRYKNCELQENIPNFEDGVEVVKYYFFCDFKSKEDQKKALNDIPDTISVHINTSVAQEIGLYALFIGDIYTTTYGSSKIVRPDCGHLEIENTGVTLTEEPGFAYIGCNNSFRNNRDHLQNREKRLYNRGNINYEFTCDPNGQWVGKWPVCIPIVTCPKNEIFRDRDPTVEIEEIENVYYINSTQWFAINDTRVRYTCNRANHIMVGKTYRICQKNGEWSNKSPYCTGTTSLSIPVISGILLTVLILFVLIILIVFRLHSKRVERELTQTRYEIRETAKRSSEEIYTDVINCNLYEDNNGCQQMTQIYELIDYETFKDQPEYDINKGQTTSSEYLEMTIRS